MKTRLDVIFLSSGIGLFLCTLIARAIALLAHSDGNGIALWLLLPSFLLISIGADRQLWHKSEDRLLNDSIWFAPNS
jgi:hypothetical protein